MSDSREKISAVQILAIQNLADRITLELSLEPPDRLLPTPRAVRIRGWARQIRHLATTLKAGEQDDARDRDHEGEDS